MLMFFLLKCDLIDFFCDALFSMIVLVPRSFSNIITFCLSRRRREMYCGHARLCVCLCLCVSEHYFLTTL